MYLCVAWARSIFNCFNVWSMGWYLKIWECFFFFAFWAICLVDRHGDCVRPAALLPTTSHSGDQSCSLGWAGGEGDPAEVWLRSNPGDYYHWDSYTHKHTQALVFAAGVGPDSHGFPWSEVITRLAILHCEPRFRCWCCINSLSSLCAHCFLHGCIFMCVCRYLKRAKEQKETGRLMREL